jgi:hypothetical protein
MPGAAPAQIRLAFEVWIFSGASPAQALSNNLGMECWIVPNNPLEFPDLSSLPGKQKKRPELFKIRSSKNFNKNPWVNRKTFGLKIISGCFLQ